MMEEDERRRGRRFRLCAVILLLGLLPAFCCSAQVRMMFWNLENYFDPFDDSTTRDEEFTPGGERHWTWKKFLAKRNGIAKTIIASGGDKAQYPLLIGLAECENRLVLRQLVQNTPLARLGYELIHRDSPDPRGIDVAVLYRKDLLQIDSISVIPVQIGTRRTRDILKLTCRLHRPTDIYVVHLPSKYGGARETAPLRMQAAGILKKALAQSLTSGHAAIVMGDFNDGPSSPPLLIFDGQMTNLARKEEKKGRGTIRYHGRWEMIDQFLVSEDLKDSEIEILMPPHLLEKDEKFLGVKPLRTYYGPRYHGGISDHLPILIELQEKSLTFE